MKARAVGTQAAAAETTAGDKAEEEDKRFLISCELVQCLDKGSVNFLRLSKPDAVAAWRALAGKTAALTRLAFRRC